MNPSKKCTAIKTLAAFLLAGACSLALAAQVAGTVINLSGPLLAKKADGTVKVLAARSEVEQGDTLVSEKNTYAQIKFIDNSEITLKPGTTFKIEAFSYDAGKPEGDSANFALVKGGLRSITGLLGKRNREKFQLKTPSATIGIRGTTFIAEWVEPAGDTMASRAAWLAATTAGDNVLGSPLAMPVPGAKSPGLYVQVLDGIINLSNGGGAQIFTAGQFGYTASFKQPPIVLPANPGMQFTLPPAFSAPTAINNQNSGKAANVDCEVR
ncbi:MAG: FecR domain-containing protein [Massilia sp.]